jgi:DNA (cytosine-5)-methyltransferase 1
MSLGFQQAGFNVAAAIDSDAINVEYHGLNFPDCNAIKGDLTTLTATDIRNQARIGKQKVTVVFGGPPCQGFSLIGKRDVKDDRNQLIFRFITLVAELGPDYFVMENVYGLTVGQAKEMLAEFVHQAKTLGYDVVEPIRVLDASKYGVPQRRKRVFVLGYKRGLDAPKYPQEAAYKPTVQDALADLPDIDSDELSLTSDVLEVTLGKPSSYARMLRQKQRAGVSARNAGTIRLSGCLRTCHTADTVTRFADTLPGTVEAISRFPRLDPKGVSSTLRAGTGPERGSYMAARPIHPSRNRCITVREAARLHSFPDWFQFHPTKWHAFRQIGNSVPPFLARAVARAVFAAISHRHSPDPNGVSSWQLQPPRR